MTSDNELPTVMITIYGKPKQKKTSDALAAFPTALFLGVPSAVTLVAQNELGFTPSVHPDPPKNLVELVTLLRSLADTGKALEYGAVVVDDLSHMCKRSMLEWTDQAPTGRSGKKDRFFPYQQLNQYLLEIAHLSRHLGVHLAMTFHERMPGTNADGRFCPGGPDVPSRNQVETLPSWCDVNIRAIQSAVSGRTDNPLHLRWACQDGIARGVLLQQAKRSLFDFQKTETKAANSPTLPPPPSN